ncbi:MAG: TerB family tellurite resistance protein [Bacteroidetes bacterium]|nr:TerB family tellurite resistance protein [Bacteroidota bacterium]MBI3481991.1 TerB family tellurite resistance protein [Bacteroidota bacterium]
MVLHKQFQDFVLFLYTHMALCDGSMHENEELVILDKMSKIFPTEADPKKKLNAVVAEYKSIDPALINTIVRDSFKFFDQVKFAQKYKIYTDMYDVVNADGRVEESERKALNSLRDIIDMDAEIRHGN